LTSSKRAKDAGYHALVVTIDGAGGANREYNSRISLRFHAHHAQGYWNVLKRPRWIKNVMLKSLFANGVPTFANYPEEFQGRRLGRSKGGQSMAALGNPAVGSDLLRRLRDQWDGP